MKYFFIITFPKKLEMYIIIFENNGSLSNGVGERTSNFMVNVISLGLRELFSLKPFLILLGSE